MPVAVHCSGKMIGKKDGKSNDELEKELQNSLKDISVSIQEANCLRPKLNGDATTNNEKGVKINSK